MNCIRPSSKSTSSRKLKTVLKLSKNVWFWLNIWVVLAILGVTVRLKIYFGVCSYRWKTSIFYVSFNSDFYFWPNSEPFFGYLVPKWATFGGWGQDHKEYQFWFVSKVLFYCFQISPIWDVFCPFWFCMDFWGFGVWG